MSITACSNLRRLILERDDAKPRQSDTKTESSVPERTPPLTEISDENARDLKSYRAGLPPRLTCPSHHKDLTVKSSYPSAHYEKTTTRLNYCEFSSEKAKVGHDQNLRVSWALPCSWPGKMERSGLPSAPSPITQRGETN